ncbi:NinB protein [Mesorhizobium sp. J18]|uniref:recombination protein NinB n=1 Tax=Mesorhizobium sp. J18 TaxID=935263 RepID=UPI001199B024|nr:recombination protein NinB [Mesorhizobium sp. J18]TWG90365.1 NinB protein [Mesorhizobium sp. J18]
MGSRKTFVLINDRVRNNALEAVRYAAEGYVVTIAQPTRSSEQNAKLHALLSDLARSDLKWAGKRRSMEEWKALIISGHAVATKQGGEVVPGLEGEFVAIRESSASMSVSRAASLIEYLTAFCVANGVELRETRYAGFNEPSGTSSPPDASGPGAVSHSPRPTSGPVNSYAKMAKGV